MPPPIPPPLGPEAALEDAITSMRAQANYSVEAVAKAARNLAAARPSTNPQYNTWLVRDPRVDPEYQTAFAKGSRVWQAYGALRWFVRPPGVDDNVPGAHPVSIHKIGEIESLRAATVLPARSWSTPEPWVYEDRDQELIDRAGGPYDRLVIRTIDRGDIPADTYSDEVVNGVLRVTYKWHYLPPDFAANWPGHSAPPLAPGTMGPDQVHLALCYSDYYVWADPNRSPVIRFVPCVEPVRSTR